VHLNGSVPTAAGPLVVHAIGFTPLGVSVRVILRRVLPPTPTSTPAGSPPIGASRSVTPSAAPSLPAGLTALSPSLLPVTAFTSAAGLSGQLVASTSDVLPATSALTPAALVPRASYWFQLPRGGEYAVRITARSGLVNVTRWSLPSATCTGTACIPVAAQSTGPVAEGGLVWTEVGLQSRPAATTVHVVAGSGAADFTLSLLQYSIVPLPSPDPVPFPLAAVLGGALAAWCVLVIVVAIVLVRRELKRQQDKHDQAVRDAWQQRAAVSRLESMPRDALPAAPADGDVAGTPTAVSVGGGARGTFASLPRTVSQWREFPTCAGRYRGGRGWAHAAGAWGPWCNGHSCISCLRCVSCGPGGHRGCCRGAECGG